MTDTEIRQAARELARRSYVAPNVTAELNLDDLSAAVEFIDTAMDRVISTIPAGWQDRTIKQALAQNLPEPFLSTATAQQKALALMVWAMKETNII